MSKETYFKLESWESCNDLVCEITDAIQELSTKSYATAVLISSLEKLVEERFTIGQKLQAEGIVEVNQIHAAFLRETANRELHKGA